MIQNKKNNIIIKIKEKKVENKLNKLNKINLSEASDMYLPELINILPKNKQNCICYSKKNKLEWCKIVGDYCC